MSLFTAFEINVIESQAVGPKCPTAREFFYFFNNYQFTLLNRNYNTADGDFACF